MNPDEVDTYKQALDAFLVATGAPMSMPTLARTTVNLPAGRSTLIVDRPGLLAIPGQPGLLASVAGPVASEQSSERRPGVGVLPMAQLHSATTPDGPAVAGRDPVNPPFPLPVHPGDCVVVNLGEPTDVTLLVDRPGLLRVGPPAPTH